MRSVGEAINACLPTLKIPPKTAFWSIEGFFRSFRWRYLVRTHLFAQGRFCEGHSEIDCTIWNGLKVPFCYKLGDSLFICEGLKKHEKLHNRFREWQIL